MTALLPHLEALSIFVWALAVGTVASTITASNAFRPFRYWAEARLKTRLFECAYCLGHWLALPLIGYYPILVQGPRVLQAFVSWQVVVGTAYLWSSFITRRFRY